MTDVHEPEIRSYNMSRIKGKDTKPELIVRKYLFSNGFRYRLHVKTLPGRPDIYFPKYNTVVQINGCFWHGHIGCKFFKIPETRRDWWEAKIDKTRDNDRVNMDCLANMGLRVLVVWECELKGELRNKTLADLIVKIKN